MCSNKSNESGSLASWSTELKLQQASKGKGEERKWKCVHLTSIILLRTSVNCILKVRKPNHTINFTITKNKENDMQSKTNSQEIQKTKPLQVFQSQSIYSYNLCNSQVLMDPIPFETFVINK